MKITSWGWNGDGQCDMPAAVNFIAVSGGTHHGVALKHDGTLVARGKIEHGQLDVPSGHGF